ncbi:hypothetical protein [Colwellia echini]|uniref:Type IV pilus biogenesis protein PilP n=1 Tax=Colwellia echini TaxID=1982103 RepID=A0ABY3MZG7_9GAMM|nr:hypothetical protein [Colwellia echini]TYK66602.1 hypothetical protein CWS31_004510 [Colwellia echini]
MLSQNKRYYCSVILLFLTQSIFTHGAIAGEDGLDDNILTCSKIANNQARLSCFDALTQTLSIETNSTINLKNTTAENTDTGVNEILASEAEKQAIDDFAKDQLKQTSDELAKQVNSIVLTISALSKDPYGKWTIIFENGQKWQQKDSFQLTLTVGQRVMLTKGALSAVYLQKENSNKRIKVKRLQ